MILKEAEQMKMPFGKYEGRTLGEIASENLLYLDLLNSRDLRSPLLGAVALIYADRRDEIDSLVDRQHDHERFARGGDDGQ